MYKKFFILSLSAGFLMASNTESARDSSNSSWCMRIKCRKAENPHEEIEVNYPNFSVINEYFKDRTVDIGEKKYKAERLIDEVLHNIPTITPLPYSYGNVSTFCQNLIDLASKNVRQFLENERNDDSPYYWLIRSEYFKKTQPEGSQIEELNFVPKPINHESLAVIGEERVLETKKNPLVEKNNSHSKKIENPQESKWFSWGDGMWDEEDDKIKEKQSNGLNKLASSFEKIKKRRLGDSVQSIKEASEKRKKQQEEEKKIDASNKLFERMDNIYKKTQTENLKSGFEGVKKHNPTVVREKPLTVKERIALMNQGSKSSILETTTTKSNNGKQPPKSWIKETKESEVNNTIAPQTEVKKVPKKLDISQFSNLGVIGFGAPPPKKVEETKEEPKKEEPVVPVVVSNNEPFKTPEKPKPQSEILENKIEDDITKTALATTGVRSKKKQTKKQINWDED